MKQKDMTDVFEAVLATVLCSASALFVGWLGKKYFGMDTSDNINVFINNKGLDMDEVEPDDDCECDACKASRK